MQWWHNGRLHSANILYSASCVGSFFSPVCLFAGPAVVSKTFINSQVGLSLSLVFFLLFRSGSTASCGLFIYTVRPSSVKATAKIGRVFEMKIDVFLTVVFSCCCWIKRNISTSLSWLEHGKPKHGTEPNRTEPSPSWCQILHPR